MEVSGPRQRTVGIQAFVRMLGTIEGDAVKLREAVGLQGTAKLDVVTRMRRAQQEYREESGEVHECTRTVCVSVCLSMSSPLEPILSVR